MLILVWCICNDKYRFQVYYVSRILLDLPLCTYKRMPQFDFMLELDVAAVCCPQHVKSPKSSFEVAFRFRCQLLVCVFFPHCFACFPSGPRLDMDPDIVAALDEDFNYDDPDNILDDDFIIKANSASGAVDME